MRQTLFYIQDHIAGIPVFGIGGLLIVLWIAFSVGLIIWLARRQGFNADTLSYLPIIAIVAAAIIFLLPNLVEPVPNLDARGLPIRSYGVMTMLGIVAGVTLAARRAPAAGINPEAVYSFAVWLCVAGFVGARLFHVIEYWDMSYRQETDGVFDATKTFAAIVNIPKGGLVVYGSFIGGMIAFAWYMRKHRLPALAFADLMAPSMVLGLTIGRIGCLLNGCCFGGASELPWSVTFPIDSPPYEHQFHRGLNLGLQVRGKADGAGVRRPSRTDGPGEGVRWPVIGWVGPELARQGLKPGQRIVRIGKITDPSTEQVWNHLAVAATKSQLITMDTDEVREVRLTPLPARARSLPVQPTQIYSAINALLLCLFLLAVHPFRGRDGVVFGLLISIYPVTRILLEIIRTDEAPMFGTGLSISQIVSIILLVSVVLYWVYIVRRPPSLWADSEAVKRVAGRVRGS